jgi:hypothetical protein
MMKLTWTCHSSDPRDKVFGILGLAQSDENAIRPNYTIPTQHAFTGIFAHCLVNLKDTGVLFTASGVRGGGSIRHGYPRGGQILHFHKRQTFGVIPFRESYCSGKESSYVRAGRAGSSI